jgi:acyl-homoserine lactone acylase PvdQ
MDKVEILKMAFEKAETAKEAMELAREMEAFINGVNPVPKWVTESQESDFFGTPVEMPRYKRKPWTQQDLLSLNNLIVQNYALDDMPAILGRSRDAIKTAINRLKTGEYSLESEEP